MLLDFKEIPKPNEGGGLQDTFELFARDVLEFLGYKIVQHPDRGPDGKKDLIVDEVLSGVMHENTLRWLVSCKHFAHSGGSVKDSDEINITERLKQHGCNGFMAFYSTLPSAALNNMLQAQPHFTVFDHERIESLLLRNKEGYIIANRYFPVSFKQFMSENPQPAEIFEKLEPLCCEICGKNLLAEDSSGLYAMTRRKRDFDDTGTSPIVYEDMYFACKGVHDHILQKHWLNLGYIADWEDVTDMKNPSIWISRVMAFLNGIQRDRDLSDKAFEKMKSLLLKTYPYICRNLTEEEREHFKNLWDFGLMC